MRGRQDMDDLSVPVQTDPDLPEGFRSQADALRSDPGFRSALAEYCRRMAETAPMQWPIYKLFDQMDRYFASYMLIHNYYAWRRTGALPPTMSALQILAGSSARQTAGLVAAMKVGRLVLSEPDQRDRRVKHLRPSPAMIEEIGRSMRFFVAAADRIAGRRPGLAAILEQDVDVLGDLVHRSAAYVLAFGTLIHPFPRVHLFAKRDCGYLVLTAVLSAHYAATLPNEHCAASLSYRSLAQRFQVSPAHIGNLFKEADEKGWFKTGARGQLVSIDDNLIEEFERWASWQMVHFSTIAMDIGDGGLSDASPPQDLPGHDIHASEALG